MIIILDINQVLFPLMNTVLYYRIMNSVNTYLEF